MEGVDIGPPEGSFDKYRLSSIERKRTAYPKEIFYIQSIDVALLHE